jgi:hypothetical protein
MSIYQFKPTFLYIKQHSITGKLYFGKTIRNPETYFGSGKHWLSHIKTHGSKHVVTLWYCLFLDQESCMEFAVNFSKEQKIVESTEWLNLKYENGVDGGNPGGIPWNKGKTHSPETREKLRLAGLGENHRLFGKATPDATKKKLSESMSGSKNPNYGKKMSDEQKQKIRLAMIGNKNQSSKRTSGIYMVSIPTQV